MGYIGTELCKIYSGYSWHHDIIVIDNRFISERVNQLRNWNIEFIQGDILDKELVNKYFRDANVVHHLAGITDVPRTKSRSSDEKNERIKLVAEEGTQNILNVISDECKIIFPLLMLFMKVLIRLKKIFRKRKKQSQFYPIRAQKITMKSN